MSVKTLLAGALALAGTAKAAPTDSKASANPDGFMNMVYYTDWSIYARDFPVANMTANTLTHVNFAFLNVHKNGTVFSGDVWADIEKPFSDETPATYVDDNGVTQTKAYGCVGELYKLKEKNRRLKTLLSIGGWTWSTNFTFVAAEEASRDEFAKSSVNLLRDWGFDGIDVDWEYPKSKADGDNFVTLLKRVRQELDDYAAKYTPGYHYPLTIAAPAGQANYQYLDMKGLGEVLDYVNLMGYDYGGSWSAASGYLANVYPSTENPASTEFNTEDAVEAYLNGGVPSHKLVLGMPVYGRSFDQTDGMGKSFVKPADDKVFEAGVDGTWEIGAWDYKALPLEGAEEFDDNKVIGHYSYDKTKKQLISYDTPKIIASKVDYLRSKKLGGSMFWEASADKLGEGSLIAAAYEAQGGTFRASCSQNQLNYPDSIFVNIAAAGKGASEGSDSPATTSAAYASSTASSTATATASAASYA
ncbi:hypothetical protein BROUX41_006654 [Berkeleyomyces rouxiae]